MAEQYTAFVRDGERWTAQLEGMTAQVERGELRLYSAGGQAIGHFPLAPRVAGGLTALGELRLEGGVLHAPLVERPEMFVNLWARGNRVHYRIYSPFNGAVDLGYFPESTFHGPRWHAFVPDAEDINFVKSEPKTVTVAMAIDRSGETTQGRMPTWMLSPAPRACALEYDGGWLAVCAPRALPVGSTTFGVDNAERFEITFAFYRMPNTDYDGPEVTFSAGLVDPYQALDELAAVERTLGDVEPPVAPADWWPLPVFHTWGEQFWEAQAFERVTEAQTEERVRGWIAMLRERVNMTNFTVALDAGWYQDAGDFRVNAAAYGSEGGLRALIGELHRQGQHVLLWLPPFSLERTARVTDEYQPEGYVKDPDGSPLGLSDSPLIADFTFPPMREHLRQVVQHLLGPNGLDADGLVLSELYHCPDPRVAREYDLDWAVGDQLGAKVLALIAEAARSVKGDALISAAGAMPYLQRSVNMVRLNDVIGSDVRAWWRRARVVSRAMPGALIDHGGWALHRNNAVEHWMAQPVYSVPSLYHLTHLDDRSPLTDEDFHLLSAIWAVYDNAPLWPGQRIVLEPEAGVFARYYADGTLAAQSLASHTALITASAAEVRACASQDCRVVLPVTDRQRVTAAHLVSPGAAAPLEGANLAARPLAVDLPDAGRSGQYLRLMLEEVEMRRAA
ncbi:MAG: hypothetical protein ACYDCO_16145 [Armatimonadota bacterium]